MERLVVVRCPTVLDEVAGGDEGGAAARTFAGVVAAVGAFCPWVATVETGICSLPARGPARYFGGEAVLVDRIATAVGPLAPCQVGVADGRFAAQLAAGRGRVVPVGGTAAFLAPFPVDVLGLPELAELLGRLGIRTLGQLAALPERHVLGRFGTAGVVGHRVAAGRTGEPPPPPGAPAGRGRRAGRPGRTGRRAPSPGPAGMAGEVGFWGGSTDADLRAARAFASVQHLLGPGAVVTPRLQGGRSPAERARFVTWTTPADGTPTGGGPSSLAAADPSPDPWPGRIPPPAPAVVHAAPLDAELAGPTGTAVGVSGRGLLTATPARLSVAGGPWAPVDAWAGPWPADERWWSRSRRRAARLQAVAGPAAYLLVAERGRWWVEATYG